MTYDFAVLEEIRRMRRRDGTFSLLARRLVGRPRRFCEVDMRGSMGEVRGKERWGILLANQDRPTDGMDCWSPQARADLTQGFLVRFDDGKTEWRPWSDSFRDESGHVERKI